MGAFFGVSPLQKTTWRGAVSLSPPPSAAMTVPRTVTTPFLISLDRFPTEPSRLRVAKPTKWAASLGVFDTYWTPVVRSVQSPVPVLIFDGG
jgi:hypothetical protein